MLLGGCGTIAKIFHRKPKPVDTTPHDVFIGTVEMVNPEQHFVLIHTSMHFKMEAGWKLETRPVNGSKSVLSITPEQKLNYLSADIAEGFPQRGEVVVLPATEAKKLNAAASTPTPSATDTPNPQNVLPPFDPGTATPGQALPPSIR